MTRVRSDEELMLAAARGEEPAFAELVRRHHAALEALFRRRGLDSHAAEDCVQETFLRLLGAADSYRPRAPFRAFLLRLARNALIDWRRRRAVRPDLADGDAPTQSLLARAGVPAADRLDLDQALDCLSAKLRAVVELSVRNGYSHVEIARLLDVPYGTVKTRMHWAVRKLREALRDD
jgi:RNA polymerase sigma-70 factor (ECF subfamily)